MSDPLFRRYALSDLPAVIAVFQRSIHELAARDYSPAQLAAWSPETSDLDAWATRLATGGVFISERENQIVGFARIDESGVVDLLYVHPRFARHGIATALLSAVCAWARQRGIDRLRADVSITARPLFERKGFRVVRQQSIERHGVTLENFRMERDTGSD
jgi:putative acetyltransferase